jgi:lipoprotein-anchoring transpeptidase ErfK/SrfK
LILLGGATGLLVLLIAVVGVAVLAVYSGDRIMPGVSALGVNLGGRSRTQAVALLQQDWGARRIMLDAGDRRWPVSPAMLGMMLDADATVERAHQQGRSPNALKQMVLGKAGLAVTPAWRFDPALAESNLRSLKPQLDTPPQGAGLRVVNGRVEATPPVPGRSLDVVATAARLQGSAEQVIREGRLELVMVPLQPPVGDVSAALAQAEQLVNHRLVVQAYDPILDEGHTWEVPPDEWGAWLSLSVNPDDSSQLEWALKPEEVQAFLGDKVGALGDDRRLDDDQALAAVRAAAEALSSEVRLRIYHTQRQHTVQPGETLSSIARDYGMPYPWIQQANPPFEDFAGIGDTLSVGQVVTIPSPDVLLPLPVVENKRVVVSLSQQRAWVYENGALKWEWPVSTGIPSSPTAPGIFQVQTHELNAYASNWNLWMPHFVGIYRPVPTSDFMNGFHGFPTRGGSTLLWTDDLGHPVTYGCILLSSENAAALYEWAEAGVVVEVRP